MKRRRRPSHLQHPELLRPDSDGKDEGSQTGSVSKSGNTGKGELRASDAVSRSQGGSLRPDRVFGGSDEDAGQKEQKPSVVYPSAPDAWVIGALVVSAAVILWAFWPVWVNNLVRAWNREADYSHGWFVIPITGYLLWNFRSSMPQFKAGFHWGGVALLAFVAMVRVASRWAYFDFVDGWMIPVTAIGVAWAFGGRHFAWWALPSLCFLFFMVPLPFRIENELSRPLQWIATNASCFVLQTLGQPAIAEGTTILLGENTLEVERACSGLRIFFGVFALSYICAVLLRRSWWEGVLLVLASIPIALISNAARIVATGLCYQWFSGETARHFAHDFAGYVMIFFAAGLFGLTLWYLRWLIQDAITMDQASLKRI